MSLVDVQQAFDSSVRRVLFLFFAVVVMLNYVVIDYHDQQLQKHMYRLVDRYVDNPQEQAQWSKMSPDDSLVLIEANLQRFMEFHAIVRLVPLQQFEIGKYGRYEDSKVWRDQGGRDFRILVFGDHAYKIYLDWREIYSSFNYPHYLNTTFLLLIVLTPIFGIYLLWIRFEFVNPLAKEVMLLQPALSFFQGVQMLAHDIRRPFALVKAFVRILEREKEASKQQEIIDRYKADISRATKSVDHMVRDILEYGSSALPKMKTESLDLMLFHSLKTSCLSQTEKIVNFRFQLQHPLEVVVDAERCERIFVNMINNAMQAVNDNGFVWIESTLVNRQKKLWIRVTIGNSGSFISPEDCDKIFAPFFSKGKSGGTGLGLSIVKKIVEEHGGEAWVQSEEETGTEFYCTLPASDQMRKSMVEWPLTNLDFGPIDDLNAKQTVTSLFSHQEQSVKQPDVIVIEDDILMAEAWQRTLAPHLIASFVTPSQLKEHWEWLDISNLRLVVSDMYFGEFEAETGHDVAMFIKERVNVPVVISTNSYGLAMESCRAVDIYVPKEPVSLDQLLDSLLLKSS